MPSGRTSGCNGKGDEPETMSHSILKQVKGLCIFTQDGEPGICLSHRDLHTCRYKDPGAGCRQGVTDR